MPILYVMCKTHFDFHCVQKLKYYIQKKGTIQVIISRLCRLIRCYPLTFTKNVSLLQEILEIFKPFQEHIECCTGLKHIKSISKIWQHKSYKNKNQSPYIYYNIKKKWKTYRHLIVQLTQIMFDSYSNKQLHISFFFQIKQHVKVSNLFSQKIQSKYYHFTITSSWTCRQLINLYFYQYLQFRSKNSNLFSCSQTMNNGFNRKGLSDRHKLITGRLNA